MIKKRNLDPSLIQWIMQQTGLGPGVGELFWVATAPSSTNQFRQQLQSWGVEQSDKIYDDPGDAYDAMEIGRNDVMLIMPGKYTGTGAAPYTFAKDYTHYIGLGPPQRQEYGGRGVVIRTLSDSGVFAATNTGDLCSFHNIAFQQWGENAAALTSFREAGHMNTFKGCHFFGHIRSDTVGLTTSSSLEIADVVAAGLADTFIECVFGGSGGAKRTAINGTILFAGDAGAKGVDMQFKDCQFMSWMEDADPCAVLFAESWGADRLQLFEGCTFYNFMEDHSGTTPLYVFRYAQAIQGVATHDVILKRCSRLGFAAWAQHNEMIYSSDSKGATDGGEAIAVDES